MLRPCTACHRHVAIDAAQCAFCAAPLLPAAPRAAGVAAGRVGRAAIFAGAIAFAPLGCGGPGISYEPLPAPAGSASAVANGGVRGRVTRHTGDSAAHWNVTLHGEPLRKHLSNGLDHINIQTAADGTFAFDDIPPGDYWLMVSDRRERSKFVVRAGQAVVLELELDKPRSPDPRHMAKPYGAPPARRRIV